MNEPWAAVVVVISGPHVLAVARDFHPTDLNFPGGRADPGDKTPMQTAVRELYEETGIRAQTLELLDRWDHNGRPTYAYLATVWKGRPRSSPEGKACWVFPSAVTSKASTFHRANHRLIQRLGQLRA